MLAFSFYGYLASKASGLVGQSVNDFAFRFRLPTPYYPTKSPGLRLIYAGGKYTCFSLTAVMLKVAQW